MKEQRKRRRGWGEGSVWQHTDGTWRGQVSLGKTNGKRSRKSLYGPTKQSVLDQMTLTKHRHATNTLAEPSASSVSEYLKTWLRESAATTVAASTLASYQRNVTHHIEPAIGHIRLQKLTPLHVQSIITGMAGKDASSRLQQYVYSILHQALQQAVKWGVLQSNPCDRVQRPKKSKYTIHPLDGDECRRLVKAAQNDHEGCVVILAIQTGARQGELRALHWKDFDKKNRRLHITRTMSPAAKGEILKEPKTRSSRRTITLPDAAYQALILHSAEAMRSGNIAAKWIFPGEGDMPMTRGRASRVFLRILKAAGLPVVRFHDLRHSHATLLLSQGTHPKIVQERLGHGSISITLDTYSHILPSMQSEASDKLNKLFG